MTDFCLYSSWEADRRLASHGKVGWVYLAGRAVKFSPSFLNGCEKWGLELLWRLRNCFSQTIFLPYSFVREGKALETYHRWLPGSKHTKFICEGTQKDEDGNNPFKCHWWIKCQTYINIFFTLSQDVSDNVNYGEKVMLSHRWHTSTNLDFGACLVLQREREWLNRDMCFDQF